jgi:hypothetical protein
MKRIALMTLVALCLTPISLMAQKPSRFEVGAFADYLLLSQPPSSLSNLGIGGRFDFRIGRKTLIESEIAYDPARNFTSIWTASSSGAALPFVTSVRTVEALFGPKFNVGSLYGGRLQPFFTLKAGWINFASVSAVQVNFTSDLGKITSGGSAFDSYGAIGVEGFKGRWGGRFEIGDEAYYDGSGHQNLRITVGPVFRF